MRCQYTIEAFRAIIEFFGFFMTTPEEPLCEVMPPDKSIEVREAFGTCNVRLKGLCSTEECVRLPKISAHREVVNEALNGSSREMVLLQLLEIPDDNLRLAVMDCIAKARGESVHAQAEIHGNFCGITKW